MQYTVEKLDKSQVQVSISLEKDEWKGYVNAGFQKNRGKYRVPSFRPGKAPMSLVINYYGTEPLYQDGVDEACEKEFSKICDEAKIQPISRANIDIGEISDEGAKVTLTFDVEPEFELGQYKDLVLAKAEIVAITDEKIDEEINHAREERSILTEITGRAAQKGDTATIDFVGLKDGVPFEGGSAEGHALELGGGNFIPGFEDGVIGMEIGATKDIEVTFPESYQATELAGKPVVFVVTLHKLEEKILPEVNDDFAGDLGFDSVAAYKADIKAKLEDDEQKRATYQEDDSLVNKIVENTTIAIPVSLISEEIGDSIQSMCMRYGIKDFEQYLSITKQSEKDVFDAFSPKAEKTVKSRLVIQKIIEVENLTIEDEAAAEIKKLAEEAGISEEEQTKNMQERGVYELQNKLLIEKLFATLRSFNKFE
jgi:trigger factor